MLIMNFKENKTQEGGAATFTVNKTIYYYVLLINLLLIVIAIDQSHVRATIAQ